MNARVKKDVVIVGAGLTGLTLAYYLKKAGIECHVLEMNNKVGGVIQSHNEDGFLYESGPNTGVLSNLEITHLFEDLDGTCKLLKANNSAKHRWIWKKESWHALPEGLVSAIKTPLFTWYDKFRILKEPFRKKGDDPYESVAEMVKRRMGKSYLNYAVDPFISGIYAGDPYKLVTRFALPKLYQLEQNYGSFIKGSIKKKKEVKTEDEKKITREVFSVEGGLSNLIKALEHQIGSENICIGCSDGTVKYLSEGYETSFTTSSGNSFIIDSDYVITTVGTHALATLLPFVQADLLTRLTTLNYARVVQVVAGYKKWNGIPLNAFGGLIPSIENPDVLGILFPSSIFSDRAPEKGALISIFMGGMRNPGLIDKSDNEIKAIAFENIKRALKVTKPEPDLFKILRYPFAIPQYEKSSEIRLKAIADLEQLYPGLILAGNIRDGIGMADRVKQAVTISRQVIEKIATQ